MAITKVWAQNAAFQQLHSPRVDSLLWQPTPVHQNHSLACFPKGITSSFLSFAAELFRKAFTSHAWQARSRCSENFPFLPLLFSPVLILNSLPYLWVLLLPGCESCSHILPLSSKGKKLSLNPLTLSNCLLGFEPNRIFNCFLHALSLTPVIIRNINTLAKNCNLKPLDYSPWCNFHPFLCDLASLSTRTIGSHTIPPTSVRCGVDVDRLSCFNLMRILVYYLEYLAFSLNLNYYCFLFSKKKSKMCFTLWFFFYFCVFSHLTEPTILTWRYLAYGKFSIKVSRYCHLLCIPMI